MAVTTTQRRKTAAVLLSPGQFVLVVALFALAAADYIVFGPVGLGWTFVGLVVTFYVAFPAFKLALWAASAGYRTPAYEMPEPIDLTLPRYAVVVPLRGEERVVNHLVAALRRLQYPVDKLRVVFVVEEDDEATRAAIGRQELPDYFGTIVVPADLALPRNKPRALDVAFTELSRSDFTYDYLVVFDGEDRPEPQQLLKAVGLFRTAAAQSAEVGCVQARLTFWNPGDSLVSAFYAAEYDALFRWLLPGLARLGLIPPLGGTSNHFCRAALEAVAADNGVWAIVEDGNVEVPIRGPWDPFNVTEDADLAMRLAKADWRIWMLDAVTYEEAPVSWRKARRQRSRWLQGFMATFLVHTRQPLRTIRRVGPVRFACFNLLMAGSPLSFLLNPLVWGTTILYVAARLAHMSAITSLIELLYPTPVAYAAMFSAIIGNLLLLGQAAVTVLAQQEEMEALPDEMKHELALGQQQHLYGLFWRVLFGIVFFWAFTSSSAYRGLRKLLTPSQRAHWDLSAHGHAAEQEAALQAAYAEAEVA